MDVRGVQLRPSRLPLEVKRVLHDFRTLSAIPGIILAMKSLLTMSSTGYGRPHAAASRDATGSCCLAV